MKKTTISILLFSIFITAAAFCSPADDVSRYCAENVGPPRVLKITDRIWVAVGHDLASTALIHTSAGNIIVDTGMSPTRARQMREALEAEAPAAPTAAIIYTHSHIDHIGGATVWADEGAQIWATDAMPPHLLKQYGMFIEIEGIRGGRQFGRHVPAEKLPCSALGRRVDIDAALENGVLLPTNTFSGVKELTFGDLTIELHEAHGETHDTLFVWIPSENTVISGDNFYWSFPNLYTLRGTSPRPINDWIKSIDSIRALEPEHLVPNHTLPVNGKDAISETLTNYRDAIQWVRDETVRRANAGDDVDSIAENVSLPPRLAQLPYIGEFYGQVDWSVRAIYGNELGWFDGRPEVLYPMKRSDAAAREIELMGGAPAVYAVAKKAFDEQNFRWAVHLLSKLKYAGADAELGPDEFKALLAKCYDGVAAQTINTNGAAYLMESAYELREGLNAGDKATINDRLAASIPLDHIFEVMQSRLDPEKSMDVFQSVMFKFPDEKKRYFVTVRYGIAEMAEGEPLPGTPKPVATLTVDASLYRRMALGLEKPAEMLSAGKLKVTGNFAKFMQFMDLFNAVN